MTGAETLQAQAGRHFEEPRFFSRGRILIMIGAFVSEVALFVAGLVTPLDVAAQQGLANQTAVPFGQIASASPPEAVFLIFSHNAEIALVMMAPAIGALVFAFTMYSTGLVAQAILASQGLPGAYGVVLFLLPYSLVELSAYAVAIGSGAMLIVQWRRKSLSKELRIFAMEAAAVVLLLLVAAAMEEATNLSPALGFSLWVPTGLAIAGLIVVGTRKRTWAPST